MSYEQEPGADSSAGGSVSRRAAIRLGGRAAVATTAAGLLAAAGGTAAHAAGRTTNAPAGGVRPAAGGAFQGTQDWAGTYSGVLDGRPATLQIWQVYAIYPPDGWTFSMALTDHGGVQYFTGPELIVNVGPQCHELPAFALWTSDGRSQVDFNRLLLHTWDTSYISGETSWSGGEYGCMFHAGGL
jgi:hypothetical protein